MRKFTKLWATLLLLCAINVTAQAEVKIPIELTGAVEGVTVTPIDPTTLEPLESAPEKIYAAKFTTASELQNVIQVKNMSTADAVAQGCDRIIIEFGAAVGDAWRFHSYGGQFDGIEEIGGETSHTMMINAEKTAIEDFTIFNWMGSGVQEITIKAAYFYKPDVVDPLATQKSELSAAIAKGKMFNALAYTDATFATLTAKVADGETALAAADATAESLTTATTAINDAITALALKDGFTSLKDVDFGVFDGWGATAKLTQKLDPTWDLFKATGQSYGDPSVNNRADVSAYDKLYVVAVSGTPRILLNRDADGGQWSETEAESHLIDNTKGGWSAKYFSTENGITTVDLKQLVTDKGFAHLTAIKSYDNNVISGLYLYKAPAVVPVDPTVVTWDATTKNYENGTEIGTVAIDEKINAAFDKNTNSNAPKYYTTGAAVRAYGGNTITISGEKVAISKVEFTFGTGGDNNEITADKGTFSEGVWTIDENTNIVKFTIGGTTGNRRIVAIKVTYTIDENAAPLPQPVHIANTAETAYTVAQAIELIDAGEALSETVFVKGIVSKIEKVNVDTEDDTKSYITYWISADGTEEGQQFECYKGKTMEGVAYDAIEVGAVVTVKGTMTKFKEIYEFNQGNELVSYKAPFKPLFAEGSYYIKNVGTQKYLAAGANWGTHAVVNEFGLDYALTIANEKYTFDSQVSNGGQSNFLNGSAADGPWNDGAAFGWTIDKVSEGVYTISNGTKFIAAGDNDVVTFADEATAETAQWTLVAAADRLAAQKASLEAATAENGVDATFLIKGANFNRNDMRNSAWTATKSGGNQSIGGTSHDKNTVHGVESWNNTFEISQTIENLPEGVYEFTIAGFGTNGTTKIFANEVEAAFVNTTSAANYGTALEAIAAGEFTGNTTGKFNLLTNTLKIGVKRTENKSADWTVFDNARLTYFGAIPSDAFKTAYETALANAQAALANEDYAAVTGEEKTALEKAITDYTTVDDNADAYKTATTALNAATTAFTEAKAAYESLPAAKAAWANFDFTPYTYASADKKTAAETALNAEAATSAADATAKAEAIYKAFRAAVESNAMLEGVKGAENYNEAIADANADVKKDWTGSIGTNTNEGYTDGEGVTSKLYLDGGWSGSAGANIDITRTVTVPAGKYLLTATARGAVDLTEYTMTIGDKVVNLPHIGAGVPDGVFGRGWNDASVEFESTGEPLTLQIIAKSEATQQWMSINRFRLARFPDPVTHTWDFTQWSEATVTNLKADAAASKLEGWSDVEKKADAEADVEPTEASKDNCFWATVTPDENGELAANGVLIEELKGLAFNSTYSTARSLAIAVNYPSTSLGDYEGPAYLWLGGGGKNVDCFVIKNVKAGTQIKMGVESHNTSDARGVQLFVEGAEGARDAKLTAPDGSDVAVPSVYEEQTWAVPGEDGVCNIIVYNTKGCHIYFIDAEIGETTPVIAEDPELVAPEEWTSVITNGNLATEDVTNYISKEAPSTDMIGATIVAGAGKNGSRGIVVKSAERTLTGEKDDQGNDKWTGQDWDTQFFIKLNETLPVGTKLHVEFDYKADKAALANTQAHGEPGGYKHWACIGDVNFTADWQKFSKDIEIDANMADMQTIAFNLAVEKTPTEYCFDNFGIWIQKPAPVNEWANLIVNSDMEGDDASCFYVTEQGIGGPFVAELTNGIGKDGGKAVKVQSGNNPAQAWDTQFFIRLPYQLPANTKYRVSFDYKATEAAKATTQAHGEPGAYIHYIGIGDVNFTAEWQPFSLESVVSADQSKADNPMQTIAFNLAELKTANLYIFDNVKFEVPADVVATLTANPAVNPTYYKDYVETGIASLKNSMDAKTIFNLNGQKMNKAQKGLYIINGKKVVIK